LAARNIGGKIKAPVRPAAHLPYTGAMSGSALLLRILLFAIITALALTSARSSAK
jgi:hypothetical protein